MATAAAFAAFAFAGTTSLAADAVTLTIKDHKFTPEVVEVPAGKRVKITITNADPTPEEFESNPLHIEKIIAGGATTSVFVGPLDPGSYDFVGEMHEDTARGKIVAK